MKNEELKYCRKILARKAFRRLWLLTFFILHSSFFISSLAAGSLKERYTAEHPLIYEDAWEKWPYAFINDKRQPDGFDVELVREVMRRLNLPYEVRLRHQDSVHVDLKNERADLSFGVAANYNAPFGSFGNVTICLFENSLLVPKRDSVPLATASVLRRMPLMVSDNSRAHHYLQEIGVPDSMVRKEIHMAHAVLHMISKGEGGALWNTMMLKWVLRKYHVEGYALIPTEIPSGEYRFMSGDRELLHALDSVLLVMQQEGRIDQMINRWMYPERKEADFFFLYLLLAFVGALVVMVAIIYAIRYYRMYYSHSSLGDVNSQMELILSSNGVKVWVYDVIAGTYAWMTPSGKVEEEYSSFEFSRFYPDQDFNIIHTEVTHLTTHPGMISTKTLRGYIDEETKTIVDIEVSMQAITDDYGKIYLVYGVQNNITDSKAHLDRMRVLHERYKTAFSIALGGIIRFDAYGNVIGMNKVLCDRMGVKDIDALMQRPFNIRDVKILEDIDLEGGFDHDIRFCIHTSRPEDYAPFALEGDNYFYVHLLKTFDDDAQLVGYMAFVSDITEDVRYHREIKKKERSVMKMRNEGQQLRQRRDEALRNADIVMLRYYPEAKRLFYYDSIKQRMVGIPQLRVIQMIQSRDMKLVFKSFYRADAYEDREVHIVVGTLLRNAQGERMHMEVHVCPFKNADGSVLYYFGSCKDVTSQISLHKQLMLEEEKAREADQVRLNFIRNISYSMRQPLVMIQKNLSSFKKDESIENEHILVNGIKMSTQRLVTLSDDIFILSRIEADMFRQEQEKNDFVKVYQDAIEQGLKPYRQSTVTYRIDNLYDELFLYFDAGVVSRILKEAVALSARYTHYGTINVRYMYRKDHLTVAIEDNGQGIPPDIRDNIFEPHVNANYRTFANGVILSGLEMPICHAFVKMIGGSIDVESRIGHGTVIYIDLPLKKIEG